MENGKQSGWKDISDIFIKGLNKSRMSTTSSMYSRLEQVDLDYLLGYISYKRLFGMHHVREEQRILRLLSRNGYLPGQQLDQIGRMAHLFLSNKCRMRLFNGFCCHFSLDVDVLRPISSLFSFFPFIYESKVNDQIDKRQLSGSREASIVEMSNLAIEIPLPPNVEEQRAIAKVLSDVDGLINALDALIAKKRAIKQATMQQLLTGKTRLPGFSGAWETKRLRDLFDAKARRNLVQKKDMSRLIGIPLQSRQNCLTYSMENVFLKFSGTIEEQHGSRSSK